MRLVYKFNIGRNENISSLCRIGNNLYNQALYVFRETLSKEDKWLSYFELDTIMKNAKNLDGVALVYRKGDNYYTNMECDVEYKTSSPDEYEYVYP